MFGCTNPEAINYNPLADQSDGSCTFLQSVGGVCYAFDEFASEDNVGDQSFTLSYSIESNAWVFYHDYVPDFYLTTRQQLYTLKNNSLWKHNKGAHGNFYKGTNEPFFIDIVFNFDTDVLLNSVQWITKVLNVESKVLEFSTFTHITVWNDRQCTGKIPITQFLPLKPDGVSKNLSEFSFNELLDIVKLDGEFFMKSIFENFRPDPDTLDSEMPWYDKKYLEGRHFIMRLEFDNTQDNTLSLHAVDATTDQTIR